MNAFGTQNQTNKQTDTMYRHDGIETNNFFNHPVVVLVGRGKMVKRQLTRRDRKLLDGGHPYSVFSNGLKNWAQNTMSCSTMREPD